MQTIEIDASLRIDVHDGPEPVLYLHNNDGDGVVVVRPGQIRDLRNALAEADGAAFREAGGQYSTPVHDPRR